MEVGDLSHPHGNSKNNSSSSSSNNKNSNSNSRSSNDNNRNNKSKNGDIKTNTTTTASLYTAGRHGCRRQLGTRCYSNWKVHGSLRYVPISVEIAGNFGWSRQLAAAGCVKVSLFSFDHDKKYRLSLPGLVGAGCERGPDCKNITFYIKSSWKFAYFGKSSRVEAVKRAWRTKKLT